MLKYSKFFKGDSNSANSGHRPVTCHCAEGRQWTLEMIIWEREVILYTSPAISIIVHQKTTRKAALQQSNSSQDWKPAATEPSHIAPVSFSFGGKKILKLIEGQGVKSSSRAESSDDDIQRKGMDTFALSLTGIVVDTAVLWEWWERVEDAVKCLLRLTFVKNTLNPSICEGCSRTTPTRLSSAHKKLYPTPENSHKLVCVCWSVCITRNPSKNLTVGTPSCIWCGGGRCLRIPFAPWMPGLPWGQKACWDVDQAPKGSWEHQLPFPATRTLSSSLSLNCVSECGTESPDGKAWCTATGTAYSRSCVLEKLCPHRAYEFVPGQQLSCQQIELFLSICKDRDDIDKL